MTVTSDKQPYCIGRHRNDPARTSGLGAALQKTATACSDCTTTTHFVKKNNEITRKIEYCRIRVQYYTVSYRPLPALLGGACGGGGLSAGGDGRDLVRRQTSMHGRARRMVYGRTGASAALCSGAPADRARRCFAIANLSPTYRQTSAKLCFSASNERQRGCFDIAGTFITHVGSGFCAHKVVFGRDWQAGRVVLGAFWRRFGVARDINGRTCASAAVCSGAPADPWGP
jgi:hypothetical protein